MTQDTHIHIHVHEGASPEAVRAGVEAARATPPTADAATTNGQSTTGDDKEKFLKIVERAYRDSEAKAKPLLEFLADNPERDIPFTEVSTALGFPNSRSLPGLLGAFGRRAKHRYGGVKPFEGHRIDNRWHLRISAEAAEVINRLR